jgi:hypothetical protein
VRGGGREGGKGGGKERGTERVLLYGRMMHLEATLLKDRRNQANSKRETPLLSHGSRGQKVAKTCEKWKGGGTGRTGRSSPKPCQSRKEEGGKGGATVIEVLQLQKLAAFRLFQSYKTGIGQVAETSAG